MRFLGVVSASAALVLGVAGDAMACSIKDFSAVAECEGDKGVIRVTDVDPLGVTAEVSVFRKNGADEEPVGTQTIEDSTAAGVTVTFEEDWQPKAKYRVHIYADTYVNADLPGLLTAPADACRTTDDPPPAEETPEAPEPSDEPSESTGDTPTPTPTSTPPASESTPPADTTDDNAPTPEGAPQPQGESNLAETGAGSSTGVIAGIAAALVAVGGGAIFYGMRRRGASSR